VTHPTRSAIALSAGLLSPDVGQFASLRRLTVPINQISILIGAPSSFNRLQYSIASIPCSLNIS